MTSQVLADIARNGRERVRVSLSEYRGSRFADLRVYATASDGALVPTRQGITLRAGMLRQTIAALQEAERVLSPAQPEAGA